MSAMWLAVLLGIAVIYIISVNYFISQPIKAIQQLGTQLFLLIIYTVAAITMSFQIYNTPSGGAEGLGEAGAMVFIAAAMVIIVPIIAFGASGITRLLANETRKNEKRQILSQGNRLVLPKEIEQTPDGTYRYKGRIFSSPTEAFRAAKLGR